MTDSYFSLIRCASPVGYWRLNERFGPFLSVEQAAVSRLRFQLSPVIEFCRYTSEMRKPRFHSISRLDRN